MINRCAAICLASLSIVSASVEFVSAQTPAKAAPASRVQPLPPLNTRTPELVVLAFTSSTCAWTKGETFKAALDSLVGAARVYAASLGSPMRLVRSGASVDEDPEVGLTALRQLGTFDEMTVGHGWLNAQVIRFGFRDHVGRIATPGIVVFMRYVTARQSTIDVSADSILARATGPDSIRALIRQVRNGTGAFRRTPQGIRQREGTRQ